MAEIVILTISNDNSLINEIHNILNKKKYNLNSASSKNDAFAQIKSKIFDLILLDSNLFKENEVIATIKKIYKTYYIPVILIAEKSNQSIIKCVRSAKPFGIIIKPIHETMLLSSIEIALDRFGMEIKLKESEKKIALAQELAHMGSWDLNLKTLDFTCSDEVFRIHKFPKENGINLDQWLNLIRTDERERIRRIVDDAINEKLQYDEVIPIICPDGEERTIHSRGRVIKNTKGEIIRFAGSVLDVTDQKNHENEIKKKNNQLQKTNKKLKKTLQKMGDLNQELTAANEEYEAQNEELISTQQELIASEEKYRAIIENINELVILLDEEGTILYNSPAVRHYGMEQGDTIGFNIRNFTHPDNLEKLENALNHSLHHPGEIINITSIAAVIGQGRTIYTDITMTYLPNTPGINSILLVAHDINDLILSENKLKESERVFRQFVENAIVGIVLIDEEAIVYCNKKESEILGYDNPTELIGKNPWDFIHIKNLPEISEIVNNIYNGKEMRGTINVQLIQKDGSEVIVEAYSMMFPFEGKDCQLAFHIDITERIRYNEAQKLFISILENTSDLISTSDPEGNIIYLNRSGKELLGIPPSSDISSLFIKDLHTDNAYKIISEKGVPAAIKDGIWSGETALLHRNGNEIPVSQVIMSHRKEDNTIEYLSTIMRDITKQKETEKLIKTSLHEKEVLLKEIHHRVKNNMQIISSLLQLQSNYIENDKDLELFHDTENRVRSMALIHEKLYQSDDLTQIDFNDYISNFIKELSQSYHDMKTDISIAVHAENMKMNVDRAIPCALILNELISNTYKYAFPDIDKGEIEIHFKKDINHNYLLTVSDNGIGLKDGFNIKKTDTLGFQLVNGLVKQLKGTLSYRKDDRSTFTIVFPET